MKNIFTSTILWMKNHKIWAGIIILIIAGIVMYFIFGGKGDTGPAFVLVEKGDIRQEVSVTGNVKPVSDVSLAFERGGRVAGLNVSVGSHVYAGQILVSVANADLIANLDQAKANLKKVQAGLGDTAKQSILTLAQTKISLANTIKDSYTKADDALRNKIYSLFNDPIKYNARLAFTTDTFLQEDIEDGKDDMGDSLDSWYRTLIKTNISLDLEKNYNLAKTNLMSLKSLLDKCAEAVNGLTVETSGTTQTEIDTWKLNISTARTNINTAIDILVNSYDVFTSAELAVKISQNSTLAEEASIEQAQAGVASAEAELAKSFIRAPFSGVITKVDIRLGEIVSTNQNIISLISDGNYQVESFIPEADIAKIKINDTAKTTLDAYGDSVVFETIVAKIDPAATFIDGVPTYKVTLGFVSPDDRIKSGLTANLDILTAEKTDVLTVPTRVIYTKEGEKYAKVLNSDQTESDIKVETGLRGSDGKLEIISGLNEGDKVVTSL
jgi:HlyD family secretion protein